MILREKSIVVMQVLGMLVIDVQARIGANWRDDNMELRRSLTIVEILWTCGSHGCWHLLLTTTDVMEVFLLRASPVASSLHENTISIRGPS